MEESSPPSLWRQKSRHGRHKFGGEGPFRTPRSFFKRLLASAMEELNSVEKKAASVPKRGPMTKVGLNKNFDFQDIKRFPEEGGRGEAPASTSLEALEESRAGSEYERTVAEHHR